LACNTPLKIGLTGGIGSGKSTVTELFQSLSVPVIDADIIAHQLVEPGQAALKIISQTFDDVLQADGSLNRAKLRSVVFADPDKKKQLEAILHPLVFQRMDEQARQLDAPYCILSIPLLLETHSNHRVDRILVIDCSTELQHQRVKQRDNLGTEQIEQIIASQISREQRLKQADDIIDNSKSVTELAEQVKNLHNLYLSLVNS